MRRRITAAKIPAYTRDTIWSFLAEVTTRPIDFDRSVYSAMNAEQYQRMYAEYKAMRGASKFAPEADERR